MRLCTTDTGDALNPRATVAEPLKLLVAVHRSTLLSKDRSALDFGFLRDVTVTVDDHHDFIVIFDLRLLLASASVLQVTIGDGVLLLGSRSAKVVKSFWTSYKWWRQ